MIQTSWKVARRAWRMSIQAYEARPDERKKIKRHIRWAMMSALRSGACQRWFRVLEDPIMQPFLKKDPRMAFRPMGSYLGIDYDWDHRAHIILDTYRFVHDYGGVLGDALSTPQGAEIVRVELGKGYELVVRLCNHSQFRKEGEISVFLELKPFDGCIAGFAFSFEQRALDGNWLWDMRVGAMQGRKGGDEDVIKIATKALHGFRPKSLAVFVAQEIARSLRVDALMGVGNRTQVFRAKPFYLNGTKRNILFDYDALWLEHGGVETPDHWFCMPMKAERRTPDEIKPNKRGMYAKRYELMDLMSRQIKTALPSFPR